MARSAAVSVENNFTKGLITEATGLNFPENACTDTDNCVFERTGNVTRRLGIDRESSYTENAVSISNGAFTEYLWRGAGLDGNVQFLVQQIGLSVVFFRLTGETLSTNLHSFSFALSPLVGATDTSERNCSFAAANGGLLTTHPYCDPVLVTYDEVTDTFTSSTITIKIRDMKGLDQSSETASYNIRPSTASDTVRYNLINQGWGTTTSIVAGNVLDKYNQGQLSDNQGRGYVSPSDAAKSSVRKPAIDQWFTASTGYHYDVYSADYTQQTVWPSEADVWWSFKNGAADAFDPSTITERPEPVNAPAPKGHLIYNAFLGNREDTALADLGTSSVITSLSLPVESSGYFRPSQCAFFAGRAFYAGVGAAGFNTHIYFSKVIELDVDMGRCYQILDPTAESGGNIVDSDGGVIVIPEIAQIVKLFVAGANLFIFATNGVWKISGSLGGAGFSAKGYTISRVSAINAISALSFVDVDGMPLWWNTDGIWTVKVDQLGTSVQVQSLSLSTVSTFLESISAENKRYVKGAFNPFTRIVQWIYRSVAATTVEQRYQYDKLLNFDTTTQGFYPWSLSTASPSRITGIFTFEGASYTNTLEDVVDNGGAAVTANDATTVQVYTQSTTIVASKFKYPVIKLAV